MILFVVLFFNNMIWSCLIDDLDSKWLNITSETDELNKAKVQGLTYLNKSYHPSISNNDIQYIFCKKLPNDMYSLGIYFINSSNSYFESVYEIKKHQKFSCFL